LVRTPKKSHAKKVDYRNEIYNAVLGEGGIPKDRVQRKIGGYRNAVMKDIKKMCNEKILEYKNGKLYIIKDNLPNITKRRENLQDFLKNYREIIKNVLPRIEQNAKKSGKPIFYTESVPFGGGIDYQTGKPMEGKIQRINEKCKDDLLLLMHTVNNLIRASYSVYISQISSLGESRLQTAKEIEKDQKEVLSEIKKTKRTLLEMTAEKGNLYGPAVFQMWWVQLTAGLQMQEDNLVWFDE